MPGLNTKTKPVNEIGCRFASNPKLDRPRSRLSKERRKQVPPSTTNQPTNQTLHFAYWQTVIINTFFTVHCRYRFVEIYYHRSETTHKGKVIPARVETVVLFLPDVWRCLPTRLEWESLQLAYKKQLNRKLNADDEPEAAEPAAGAAAASAAEEAVENQKASS
jgi:DBC1